jgi:hypothetical protein
MVSKELSMPRWLTELQGIVTVLDSDDNPMPRKRTIKFSDDFEVTTETVETDAGPEEVILISLAP